jgi:peptide/nickel transport system permease protein
LGAVILALAIGYLVGLIGGYYSTTWVGYLLDRITDLFLAVPIIVIAAFFPNITPYTPTPIKWILAIGLTTWSFTAKLVRAEVVSAKTKAFIEASRASGAGSFHIIFRSLLPYCIPAAASSLPLLAVTALSTQSSLDFLGFQRNLTSRIDPVLLAPYTSWGTVLSYNLYAISAGAWWWMTFPPAICIALVVLALIAIGNKVMEVAYPRLAD